jgi:hypothetical protein
MKDASNNQFAFEYYQLGLFGMVFKSSQILNKK